MPILVVREPDDMSPRERCVFCRLPTRHWFGGHIAVCLHCAKVATPEDLPTKTQWCRRERIAYGSTGDD